MKSMMKRAAYNTILVVTFVVVFGAWLVFVLVADEVGWGPGWLGDLARTVWEWFSG